MALGEGHRRDVDSVISYNHHDEAMASAIERAIERFATPFYKRRRMSVLPDSTSMTVDPDLWQAITHPMDNARFVLLLASKHSATSKWVNREIGYCIEKKGIDRAAAGRARRHLAMGCSARKVPGRPSGRRASDSAAGVHDRAAVRRPSRRHSLVESTPQGPTVHQRGCQTRVTNSRLFRWTSLIGRRAPSTSPHGSPCHCRPQPSLPPWPCWPRCSPYERRKLETSLRSTRPRLFRPEPKPRRKPARTWPWLWPRRRTRRARWIVNLRWHLPRRHTPRSPHRRRPRLCTTRWCASRGSLAGSIPAWPTATVRSTATYCHPNGQVAAVTRFVNGGQGDQVTFIDVAHGLPRARLGLRGWLAHRRVQRRRQPARWSAARGPCCVVEQQPDGSILSSTDVFVSRVELTGAPDATGALPATTPVRFPYNGQQVVSGDGRFLVHASDDGSIHLLDLDNGDSQRGGHRCRATRDVCGDQCRRHQGRGHDRHRGFGLHRAALGSVNQFAVGDPPEAVTALAFSPDGGRSRRRHVVGRRLWISRHPCRRCRHGC